MMTYFCRFKILYLFDHTQKTRHYAPDENLKIDSREEESSSDTSRLGSIREARRHEERYIRISDVDLRATDSCWTSSPSAWLHPSSWTHVLLMLHQVECERKSLMRFYGPLIRPLIERSNGFCQCLLHSYSPPPKQNASV